MFILQIQIFHSKEKLLLTKKKSTQLEMKPVDPKHLSIYLIFYKRKENDMFFLSQ